MQNTFWTALVDGTLAALVTFRSPPAHMFLHSESTVQTIINAYGKELPMEMTINHIQQSIYPTIHQITVATRFSGIPS